MAVFAYGDEKKLNTLRYGTETEIANLIQTLKSDKDNSLDEELIKLIETSKNKNVLTGILSFFADKEKSGLEERAARIIRERDNEAGETVLAAVNYIGMLKSHESSSVLMEMIDSEESRYLNPAIRALGKAGSGGRDNQNEITDFLLDYYKNNNPNNENQREIIVALGETRSPAAVSFLSGIINNNDERPVLKMAALDALSKIGDIDGLEAIIAAVTSADPNVRSSAIAALGPFPGEEAEKAILDGFRDSYFRTRIGAAQAAGKRGMAEAVQFLRYRAENDDVPAVRDEAIKALGEISGSNSSGRSEALNILNAIFSERKNSDRIRILASEMLIKVDSAACAPKVIIELDDAKQKNQNALYNGFLRTLGPAVSTAMEGLARRFLASGSVTEKHYALDFILNNEFKNMAADVRLLLDEKKNGASLSRKAGVTLDKLGLERE